MITNKTSNLIFDFDFYLDKIIRDDDYLLVGINSMILSNLLTKMLTENLTVIEALIDTFLFATSIEKKH